MLLAMLRKGIALAVGAVDYVNEGLQKIDGVIIISYSKKCPTNVRHLLMIVVVVKKCTLFF